MDAAESDEAWLDALLGIGGPASDEAEDPLAAAPDLDEAELLLAMEALDAWTVDLEVTSGAGWKSNALYSSRGEVDSAFGQLEVDFFAMKPGLGRRPDLVALLYADYRYFDQVPGLTDEHLLVGHVQAATPLWQKSKGTLSVEAIRSKQALDAATDDLETAALAITYWRPEAKASVEQEIERIGNIKAWTGLSASRYSEQSEDFDEVAFGMEWSRGVMESSRFSVGWERFVEDYAERLARESSGMLVSDPQLLEVRGQRVQAEWIFAPVDGVLGKSRARVVYQREDDRSGDYYERDQWEMRETLEWAWGDWEMLASAAYGNLDYAYRWSLLTNPSPRADRSVRASAELSRRLGESLRIFARGEWVEKDSNARLYSYDSSTATIGIRVSKRQAE